jgi:hypothetical protein
MMKAKLKDPNTSNVETQAHANVGKLGIREGIKLGLLMYILIRWIGCLIGMLVTS